MRPPLRVVAVVFCFPHRRARNLLGKLRWRGELGVDGVVLAGGLEAVGEEGFRGGVHVVGVGVLGGHCYVS